MFGYIRTDTPNLRVREDRAFRSTYCGLCHTMGRCTGCLSRLTLSYDFSFLVLVRLLAGQERPVFEKRRCPLHPFRAQVVMAENEALRHCARCAALLNLRKAEDDLADERGMLRLRARLVRPFLMPGYRRVRKPLAELDASVREALARLSEVEQGQESSVDLPAAAFGSALREIAAFGLSGAGASIAGEIGYYMGRWIYLIDALDDRTADLKRGRYNPFLPTLGGGALTEKQISTVSALLTEELMGIERGLDLLDGSIYPDGMEILKNMLYLGMPAVGKQILNGRTPGKKGEAVTEEL